MARTGVVQRRLKPPTGPPSWFRETVRLGNPPGSNHASLGARWRRQPPPDTARSRCLAGRVPPPVADEAHVSDIRLQRPGGVWRERGRSRYHPTPFRVAVSSPSTGTGPIPSTSFLSSSAGAIRRAEPWRARIGHREGAAWRQTQALPRNAAPTVAGPVW